MLAQTLRNLEQNGLVSREVYPTIPPRVDYTLTTLGTSFLAPIQSLIDWAVQNQEAVNIARSRYIAPTPNPAK